MLKNESPKMELDPLDPELPVAILLVGGENDLGPVALQLFARTYGSDFRQILFVSVGIMDYGVLDAGVDPSRGFEGTEEARRLRDKTVHRLGPYIATAHQLGFKADVRVSIATDPVDEIDALGDVILHGFPKSVFFISKMMFRKKRWFHRLLHGGTSDALKARLEKKGATVRVLPLILAN
jgi:hypothetical protein